MATKVFITDDHYMVVEGIRSMLLLEKNIEWMGHAMNATSWMAFLRQQQPDVLLLDINLPEKIRYLSAQWTTPPQADGVSEVY